MRTRIVIVVLTIALLAAGALAGAAEQLPARVYLAELRAHSLLPTPRSGRPTRTPPPPTINTGPMRPTATPTITPLPAVTATS